MLKITKLFTGGTLAGLTYEFEATIAERAEYILFMETGRIFDNPGFGSPYKIVSVEAA